MIPWLYRGNIFQTEYSDILRNRLWGFVYMFTNLENGYIYVGKKAFHSRKGRLKTESDWQMYLGSGDGLTVAITIFGLEKFKREILFFAKTPAALDYLEVREMMVHRVMEVPSYNKVIWAPKMSKTYIHGQIWQDPTDLVKGQPDTTDIT